MDGGDVLATAGRRVYVGLSSRTNAEAVGQLARLLAPGLHGRSRSIRRPPASQSAATRSATT
jgi:N-dimethylarginine dimethylaminohydrolase